jgi:hypothetical protein
VQELARQKSSEAINTPVVIMNNEKAPPAARVAAANALLDRGYGKPTQPILQTLAKIDPSTMSDEELAAIVRLLGVGRLKGSSIGRVLFGLKVSAGRRPNSLILPRYPSTSMVVRDVAAKTASSTLRTVR